MTSPKHRNSSVAIRERLPRNHVPYDSGVHSFVFLVGVQVFMQFGWYNYT